MMRLRTSLAALLALTFMIAGCERPPVDAVQRGYRGTAMEAVYNPRTVAALEAKNIAPEALPAASPDGPKARDIYQNVQVLGDLSVGQFARHMVAITSWVSPEQGCNYCHVGENFADDTLYTKVVARRMLQMTQRINADWQPHVAATGVTCYTCHRGNPVPAQAWYQPEPQNMRANFIGNRNGQNQAAMSVGLSSLPEDPFSRYLVGNEEIRVHGTTALPTDHVASIQATEGTYGLMVHMSTGLGVNCTYCHNSRHFAGWDQAPPQRVTAWHGIRMAREINNEYILPLTPVFPANRLGPAGDIGKVNCSTCHQGVFKPLYGAPMAKDFPELLQYQGSAAAPTDTPADAPAPGSAGAAPVPNAGLSPAEPVVRSALLAQPARDPAAPQALALRVAGTPAASSAAAAVTTR